ncbi:vesicle coat complex COPI, epsilon subunit [Ochromonadaceae sp. CCMP2298]|nr:vesicle coat complex COPI, epsilon subunit [Ochromonadaceae sp. CCMP2298]|mmetsp:Transcript_21421/g.46422  ORF Transcript_21421/g.46422 Transcript_21421/m.46422 type:complete len:297 (-) Transcript_21421:34-924(-)|eukprot:CAMPEP_0173224234 /NCGR_PEP_ID=MMETSP1142-20121109/4215_1 /TAXON_ID=483371 /ORGANISM="non described non described, Strain CCMP2298" /LENGTH=296 /DNA_ID=CAMNT_0014152457 /DNA_START=95 /DNA_END=985 /DNA_ORIENTATION=-
MSSEPDDLFTLRTLFWLGSYQAAINEANALVKLNGVLKVEKEEYVYRSYLGLGQYHIILSEVADSPNTPVGLQAIKLLATFLDNPSTREIAILQMKEWLADPSASNSRTLQMIAATLYMHEDNCKEAMKAVCATANMEQRALMVQLYLRIDRLDLAQKELKMMKAVDEDNTLSMLATAWVSLAMGGAKVQEAAYIYDELIDKYGSSPMLLNGLAVSKMHQMQWDEAESALKEAITKSPSDPDTLANIITVSFHLQRSQDVINRYLSQLKAKAPNHALVTSLAMFEGAFDRVAASLA